MLTLYARYIGMHIRSKTEYRASFVFVLISMTVYPLLELLGIGILFDRFGQIEGWTFYEVLLPFAIINFGKAVSEIFCRGFDRFDRFIREASFDRLLLRPCSLVWQVLGADFEIGRVGRVVTSLFFLWLALAHLSIQQNALSVLLILLMLTSASALFTGVNILRAAFCFWTIDGLEVTNILSDGGRTAMQYPVSIYNRAFRFFFTGVVPFAATNYYPTLVLLGKAGGNEILFSLSPVLGILFLLPCYVLWRIGVRHYASAGS